MSEQAGVVTLSFDEAVTLGRELTAARPGWWIERIIFTTGGGYALVMYYGPGLSRVTIQSFVTVEMAASVMDAHLIACQEREEKLQQRRTMEREARAEQFPGVDASMDRWPWNE